jgi:hypothetical protein
LARRAPISSHISKPPSSSTALTLPTNCTTILILLPRSLFISVNPFQYLFWLIIRKYISFHFPRVVHDANFKLADSGTIWFLPHPPPSDTQTINSLYLLYHCGAMDGDGKPTISPISESVYIDLWESEFMSDRASKSFLEPQNIDILFHQGSYIIRRPKMPRPVTSPMRPIVSSLDIFPAPRSTSRAIRQLLTGSSGSNPICRMNGTHSLGDGRPTVRVV